MDPEETEKFKDEIEKEKITCLSFQLGQQNEKILKKHEKRMLQVERIIDQKKTTTRMKLKKFFYTRD